MKDNSNPHLVALAGPNGAGKSTAGPVLLRKTLGIAEFVNADLIAQGLSPFNPDAAAVPAGRIMLERIHELARRRVDFAFETTLAGRSYATWIRDLIQGGYLFHVIFLWLPSPEHAVARVADRVRRGGHHVPPRIVRRRYHRGVTNFFRLYRPMANSWHVYDNSRGRKPSLIAMGHYEMTVDVFDSETWEQVAGKGDHG